MLKQKIVNIILVGIEECIKNKKLGEITTSENLAIIVEKPKNPDFGDFSVNVSPFAKFAKIAPPVIAQNIVEYLISDEYDVSVTGGFINFKLKPEFLSKALKNILNLKEKFGTNNFGNNEKVMIEYVSANPTGPLHIGHGRWAAVGSSLSNLMKFSGYDVFQEFYINDAGNQINNLANSLYIRVCQEMGKNIDFPKDENEIKNYYTGDYLIETAKEYISLFKQEADDIAENKIPKEEALKILADFAKSTMENKQKELLNRLDVHFDKFYSELTLHKSGKVVDCLEKMKANNYTYEQDGALWFKSSQFGDSQDRVLIKNDGAYTYLSADIAYHIDKLERGFSRLINIWGADHHGYIPRMKAALEAFSYDSSKLEILLGQLVNLIINNEQVRMGKRKKMVTLEELVDEVGADATRYWMIMRSIDTALDFDVDLAKSKADDNPVFYVQYAHARACSIIRNLTKPRLDTINKKELPPIFTQEEADNITDMVENFDILFKDSDSYQQTKTLLIKLDSFEDVILSATKQRAPYMIAKYAQELANDFHKFYAVARVITDDKNLSSARVCLVRATQTILNTALKLLGVGAPESM